MREKGVFGEEFYFERGTEKAQERKVINTFYKNPFDEDEGETINEWCS